MPIDQLSLSRTVRVSLLLTIRQGFRGNGRRSKTNSALAPHCGIGSLRDIAGKQAAATLVLSLSSATSLTSPLSHTHQQDCNHVVQSRSPFLQCLPPTGRQHRQAHRSETRILVRSRHQCPNPWTSSVSPATALVLSRRTQDCPLLGSHHEVGSCSCRCCRLRSSRRVAISFSERCPHGYWFDLDPLVLRH